MQNDLKSCRRLIHILLNNAQALIAYLDAASFRYRVVNEWYGVFFGKPMAEILNRTVPEVLGEEYFEKTRPRLEAAKNGETVTFEVPMESASGICWLHVSYVPDIDENGGVEGIVVIAVDITDRKRFEEELQRKRRIADADSLAKNLFVANISHELRTPLNAVFGFAQLLMDDPDMCEISRQNAQMLLTSGEHLKTIIDQVLEFTRLESEEILPEKKPFDLKELLSFVSNLFRPRAAEKNLSFQMETAPDLPRYIIGDEVRLRQVLINILSNGVKFTQRGSIRFKIRHGNGKDKKNSLRLFFTVSDSGPGIPEDVQSSVFESFYQYSRSGDKPEGAGLGLYISRKLVRSMKGELRLKSETGKGTVFDFDIEAEKAYRPMMESESRHLFLHPDPDGPNLSVLAVEDDPLNRKLLKHMLEKNSFTMIEACDGKGAIRIWEKARMDLILMDLQLQGSSGIETTRTIRRLEEERCRAEAGEAPRRIPIIALSALVFKETRFQALAAGCDAFIGKPFHEKELIMMIRQHLNLRCSPGTEPVQQRKKLSEEEILARLKKISAKSLIRIEDGLREGSRGPVLRKIETIRLDDPEIADSLEGMVRGFQYTRILKYLRMASEG